MNDKCPVCSSEDSKDFYLSNGIYFERGYEEVSSVVVCVNCGVVRISTFKDFDYEDQD